MFKSLERAACLAVVVILCAGPAGAQTTGNIETRRLPPTQGLSAADMNLYGLNTWDRVPLGARARAMGGAGLALSGDDNLGALNPAALSFLVAPQLTSESRYAFGSAQGLSAPAAIAGPGGLGVQRISNYKPGLTTSYTYNNLAYGMPLVLLGRRGGFGLAYHRMIDFENGEEARMKVTSPFGEVDLGLGNTYTGGVDAISPSLSWAVTPRLSVGGTLNFMSGTIEESGNEGVTVFGQVVTNGGRAFHQNVSGTSLDLGGQLLLTDNLSLAGVLQTGHDFSFTGGTDSFTPLIDPTATKPIRYIFERYLVDYRMSVPTKYGLGGAYKMMDGRLTLAADYWYRPWSKSRYTRQELQTSVIFPNPANLLEYAVVFTPAGPDVQLNPGFKDTHNFRIGLEWMARNSDNGGVRIPLRAGFRREAMTFSNVAVDSTSAYEALYKELVRFARDGNADSAAVAVNQIVQNGNLAMVGDKVPATTISFGTGVGIGAFSADFTLSHTSYTVDRVFLGLFTDFTRSPNVLSAREKRSTTQFTIQTSLKF